MQKVRSDHISPTLNIDRLNVGPSIGICAKSWVTWRTIQLALSFKNGSVGSFGTTKCCQGDTLYGLSRLELRCIVCAWRAVEISGFRICQGQIRNQKRAWEMFLWTSLTYYMYILFHFAWEACWKAWICLQCSLEQNVSILAQVKLWSSPLYIYISYIFRLSIC